MVKYILYKPCLSLPINILLFVFVERMTTTSTFLLLKGFYVQLGLPIYIHVFFNLKQLVKEG